MVWAGVSSGHLRFPYKNSGQNQGAILIESDCCLLNERGGCQDVRDRAQGNLFLGRTGDQFLSEHFLLGFKGLCWFWCVGSGRISWSRSKTLPGE